MQPLRILSKRPQGPLKALNSFKCFSKNLPNRLWKYLKAWENTLSGPLESLARPRSEPIYSYHLSLTCKQQAGTIVRITWYQGLSSHFQRQLKIKVQPKIKSQQLKNDYSSNYILQERPIKLSLWWCLRCLAGWLFGRRSGDFYVGPYLSSKLVWSVIRPFEP